MNSKDVARMPSGVAALTLIAGFSLSSLYNLAKGHENADWLDGLSVFLLVFTGIASLIWLWARSGQYSDIDHKRAQPAVWSLIFLACLVAALMWRDPHPVEVGFWAAIAASIAIAPWLQSRSAK